MNSVGDRGNRRVQGPLTGFLDLPDRARGLASLEDLEQQVGSLRQVTPHDRELA